MYLLFITLLLVCVCFRSALHEPESHHLLIKGAKAEGPSRRRSAAASSTRGRNRVPPKGANSDAMFMGQLLRPAALSLASTGESVVKVAGWWGWVGGGEGCEGKNASPHKFCLDLQFYLNYPHQ